MVLATIRRLVCPIPAVVATVALLLPAIAAAQTGTGRKVLAVVAIDSYGDLKQQLTWIGPHIDNPGLAGMLESVLLLSTQGKGLNGLDVKRPLGVIVTSANDDIGIHAAIPVKDLEKLLGSIQGSTGPIEKDGDIRRLTLPSGQDIEIREQDGWAVIGQRGQEFDIADPSKLLSPLVTDYTLAIETHPAVMPESLRALIAAGIQQMAAASANQGRPVDAQALQTALAGLSGVETLTIALALDPAENAVFIENKVIAVNGPKAGSSASSLTVATAATKDGGLPALSAHAVQPLNDSQRRQIVAMLDGALPQGNDKTMQIVATVVRGLVDAMADAGGLDAAVTVDTSVAGQLPLITAGAHIADGPKLEIMRSAHSAAPGFSASPVFSPHGVATSRWRASDGEPTSRCWRSRCRDAWSIRHSTDSIAWSSGTRSSLERRIDHRCVPRWLGRARRMVNVVAWFPSPWFPPPWLPRVASVDVSAGTSR